MSGDRYGVREVDFGGRPAVELRDETRGDVARVLPSVGNNCISYVVRVGEEQVDLIFSPPDPETLLGRPSGYGVPILFPWPNRIDGGKFSFQGQSHQLKTPAPGEHASHGFVLVRPWEVIEQGATDSEGAWVRSRFRSGDFPEIDEQFPFPFVADATYRLKSGALILEFEGRNGGDGDMPAGLGVHPYFPLPLGGARGDCTVQMPSETYWPLRGDPIPTGEIRSVAGTEFDVRKPTSLADRYYDHVWSGVAHVDGWSRCEYTDSHLGVTLAMESDSVFRELVLYAPEQRPVVCFEPYTCATNAFNMQNEGIDAGLIRLGPGEALSGSMRIVGAPAE